MVEKKKTTTRKPAAKKESPGKRKTAAEAAPRSKATKARAAEPAPETPSAQPRPHKAARIAARPAGQGPHQLAPAAGATHSRKRVGRGPGSGQGKTAGRGNKGQKSRSGYRHQRGFEGGQMPLHRRIPKRGFTNIFRVEYDIVNLSQLDVFDAGASVTPQLLVERRLAHGRRPVKILGDGKLGKALTVAAHKFSAGARAGIEAAGGTCEVISR